VGWISIQNVDPPTFELELIVTPPEVITGGATEHPMMVFLENWVVTHASF
jgi:hypothetical protein